MSAKTGMTENNKSPHDPTNSKLGTRNSELETRTLYPATPDPAPRDPGTQNSELRT